MTWIRSKARVRTPGQIEKDLTYYRTKRNELTAELLAGGPARLTSESRIRQIDEINRIDSICSRIARELAEMRRLRVARDVEE